ncbi:hypothetical protein B0H16DRAFT_1490593 [Mycena metata]|uniref:Uncharacterized protein n=1 Tax=Mycena metata TaxID=1033252 RepID=A0AAD7KIP9_9AGAR|nr:hypothetical protein B0H16DRAFT_1490593 [Mycena metata]
MDKPSRILPPGSNISSVPYADLLGTWHVVASTLPMWKDKKNVKITYSTIPGEPETTLDDVVSYESRSAKLGSAPSTVRGVDRLQEGATTVWKWRGKGWLMIATSKWQLLGFNVSPTTQSASPESTTEPEWVVTYFESTLFTPRGLDIYSRSKDGLSDAFIESLIEEIGAVGEVEALVKDGGMFRVPHD